MDFRAACSAGLRALRWAGIAALALALTGCTEWLRTPLSALDAAGPGAAPVVTLWWLMFWASLAITAFMVGLALHAGMINRRDGGSVPSRLLIIGGGVAFPLIVVSALLVYGLPAGQALLAAPDEAEAVHVEVNGRQWWWQVRYRDAGDGAALEDANEIHVPAGRPVHVHITTSDVIHSFWVPRLGGKLDAIPGITNVLRLKADRPGIYRGQCAEFCGDQHARMGLVMEAHADDAAWRARLSSLRARGAALAASAGPGADAFREHCAQCHTVGIRPGPFPGEGVVGPDLAGVAERRHLGAGWLPNDEGALRRWITRHQEIKPRTFMPVMDDIPGETIDAIVAFLEQQS